MDFLGMSDQNCHVRIIHIFVHDHTVAPLCRSKIHQVVPVLRVMADDLIGVVKLTEQMFSQDLAHLCCRGSWMKAVGEDQKDIFFLHTCLIQFFQNHFDRHFPVSRWLTAPFDNIRNDNRHFASFVCQFCQRLHTDGMLY